ncbi:alpha/beta hydrolase [Arthrobacter sp. H14]|uniref:alpha/beta hydrolase n=1 Tax=Arthrobacter sp. H14 TaxID=1312959 RepID=UPI00047E2391|nr:alpha/beta hydrolase [Arthrobacter sp. H14]
MALQLQDRAVAREFLHHGFSVRYWNYSPAEPDRPHPTMVMLHGFRGDHHGLLKIVERLPQARVIVPDLPGFGESAPLEGEHNVPNYVRCVETLMESLQLPEDTVLLGHSFGSIVAAHFAASPSHALQALILVNPICEPALKGSKAFLSRLTGFYYLLCARLPERAGLFLLRNRLIVRAMSILMARTKDPVLRQWIHAEHARYFSAFANRTVVLEAFRASISGTVREAAGRLRLPVLLIAATDDDLGSVAGQRQLQESIAGSKLVFLDNVGHLIHYEKPAEAAALIQDFLGSLRSRDNV